jgi:glycosyltransferase involved in cell wall biosynthesis
MKSVSIVIPALNEKEGIHKTIRSIPTSELKAMGYDVQILVVDNGSTDGTGDLAKTAGADVIVEPRRGYGRAYKTGFAHARGDIIATADADLTYPAGDIPKFVKMLEAEHLDFITTNRFEAMEDGAMPFRNKIGNGILSIAVVMLFQLRMRDPESGMWVFRRKILDNMKLGSDKWPFSHELKLEACYFSKCPWREVPVKYRARVGDTKLLSGWKVGLTDLIHMTKKRVVR